jgi:hypothetical protein
MFQMIGGELGCGGCLDHYLDEPFLFIDSLSVKLLEAAPSYAC